jgi:aldehyde dehydrogenase (NAD+)
VLPAVATGSAVVVVPSRRHPLAATDLYQVLETSDMPPGVFNIVTGPEQALAETLAHHDDVQSVWHFGSPELAAVVERASAGNMKRAWCDYDERSERDLLSPAAIQEFLREATQVKNVWVPYGEGIPSA